MELANKLEYYFKTKYIDILYYFIREKKLKRIIDFNYIFTKKLKGNIFRKALDTSSLNFYLYL